MTQKEKQRSKKKTSILMKVMSMKTKELNEEASKAKKKSCPKKSIFHKFEMSQE